MTAASTAAPRRMRAPERLPSRSAATTNGAVGQRIVVGDPRPRAVAQLELAGPPPRGEAVGEPDEQRRAGVVGVDGVEVEADAGPPGDVGRPLADPVDGPPVGTVVAAAPGDRLDAQGEVGRGPIA